MIRRLLVLLAFAALRAFAQAPATVTSDDPSTVDLATGDTVFRKNVRFSDNRLLLTADEIRVASATEVITATGHVVLTRDAARLLADTLVYHRIDGTFTAERVRLGAYPYFAEGDAASGTEKEITLLHATVTYGEPGPWQPTLVADKVVYVRGERLRTENSRAGIGHTQPLPIPRLSQNLHEPLTSFVTLNAGYRSSLGVVAEAGLHLPVSPGVMLGGNVGVYSSRGVMVGPAGNYERVADDKSGDFLRGSFRTGYINDHGDKKTDTLGRPVPENRGYVEWGHAQQIGQNFSLNAQVNWWKDSEILRDFRPDAFYHVQQPDTFVEAAYTGKNYFVSLFSRFEPNSFERVQQRLPELRFDLLPTAVGNGFYERFSASVAVLRENQIADGTLRSLVPGVAFGAVPVGTPTPAPVVYSDSALAFIGRGPELRTTRLDAYYSVSRPITWGDFFSFTPIAGARVTNYSGSRETLFVGQTAPVSYGISTPTRINVPGRLVDAHLASLDGYTRTLGEVGFDAALRTSGTFDYKNPLWKIDGLRHLFTPRLSYRYIPEASKGQAYIPPIDRRTFATYLQPLGLGDTRNIDDLHATNTLRLGFDNTLQTRDAVYGSRDLVVLNVANDFRFKRGPGERTTSEVHGELGVTPVHWLEASVYGSVEPRDLSLTEFNSALTLRNADAWSVRFSNNFLRTQIHDYAIDARFRFNERFDALTRLRYDARKARFNEQAYGLVQNLANTWRLSYIVSLYSGPRRESHFGLNIQIEAIGFR